MKRRWRIAAWVGAAASVLLLLCAAIVFAFFQKFYPAAPEANAPKPQNLTEAQRQDLDYFAHYFGYNKAYGAEDLRKAKALLAATHAKAGTLSKAQFELAIARMVTLADNGHSTLFMGPLSRANNRLPCRFYRFADGYYIIRARGACVPFLGAQLAAINGKTADAVADAMYRYSGGPRNHYEQFKSVMFFESPELLHAAGLARDAARETLTLTIPDGREQVVTLDALPPDEKAPHVYADSYLSPEPIEGEDKGWTPLLAHSTATPQFLRDYANPFHAHYDAAKRTYYVQFRDNADEGPYAIGPFVTRVKHDIQTLKPEFVIADLRLDQGGNFTTTAGLMKELSGLAPSIRHVYLLTSAWTFSAGIVSTALAKYHGGDKMTIVGENVGDRMAFWAEGGEMDLPNSKISIGFATGLHDYHKPCWRERGCFWMLYFFPVHLKTLTPDVIVPYRFDVYIHGRDPLLERARAMIAKL
jgi:hypothetical protein